MCTLNLSKFVKCHKGTWTSESAVNCIFQMKELVLLGAIGCVLVGAVPDAPPAGSESVNIDGAATQFSERNKSQASVAAILDQRKDRTGRILVQYTTSTRAVFVSYTTSALSTCFSATNTACKKRRRRREVNSLINSNIGR